MDGLAQVFPHSLFSRCFLDVRAIHFSRLKRDYDLSSKVALVAEITRTWLPEGASGTSSMASIRRDWCDDVRDARQVGRDSTSANPPE
jgi:hypothetical protein